MARTTFNISSGSITWEQSLSQIEVNETGLATITVSGAVNSAGTTMESAYNLIPDTIPTGSNGPLRATSKFAGAKIATKSVYYQEGTWQVGATYTKSLSDTFSFPDGSEQSDSDRFERRIVVQPEPILSHPVALKFPTKDKNMLANLMQGNIVANPNYEQGSESQGHEFATLDAATGEFTVPIGFSTQSVTSGGITASPLDYARLIKASITDYLRRAIRHVRVVTRDGPAPNSDYQSVGVASDDTPPGAPSLTGDYQWMLTGITDSSADGENWSTTYEYDASGFGGYLGILYKGGTQTTEAEE